MHGGQSARLAGTQAARLISVVGLANRRRTRRLATVSILTAMWAGEHARHLPRAGARLPATRKLPDAGGIAPKQRRDEIVAIPAGGLARLIEAGHRLVAAPAAPT